MILNYASLYMVICKLAMQIIYCTNEKKHAEARAERETMMMLTLKMD